MSGRRPGPSGNSSKLRMDRQPAVARISDPSLPIGRRKEIDSVMKKARAQNSGDYWDKKLLDIEEKDPNRWRHTGFKKMYLEDESSSFSGDEQQFRDARDTRRGPPPSPPRRRSPVPRSAEPPMHRRPRSPEVMARRRSPRSPPREMRRRSPHPSEMPPMRRRSPPVFDKRGGSGAVPRPKPRPPSPPPKFQMRHRSKSSGSSYSDDSHPIYPQHHHPNHHHHPQHPPQSLQHSHNHQNPQNMRHSGPTRSRSRSVSIPRSRPGAVSSGVSRARGSPPPRNNPTRAQLPSSRDQEPSHRSGRPTGSSGGSGAIIGKTRHIPLENLDEEDVLKRHGKRAKKMHVPEDPRLARPSTSSSLVAAAAQVKPSTLPSGNGDSTLVSKKHKAKAQEKLRARVKIEGEKRKKRHSSSEESEDSSSSEGETSIPTFAATTRMTLSERFGKMAQWSADRSHMDNLKTMRITKDSAGGPLKVMIEEQAAATAVQPVEPPPRREYTPAPAGHFPEELAETAPSGLMSWDDVRVRFEYYKNRGYLRDLDLQDYIKWEEWWYKYQEWLKQERYYEFWERQQMRRRRKKVPIAQRLN